MSTGHPNEPDITDHSDLAGAPTPPDNRVGHHPRVEQDQPRGRRPRPRSAADHRDDTQEPESDDVFPFAFEGAVGAASRLFVLTENRASIRVTNQEVVARYGPWTVSTDIANVRAVEVTGPYRWWKVAGPPHLSMVDRGITFASNAERGVCIAFHDPVPGIDPKGWLRHPGLTVTVADPDGLVSAIERRRR